MGTPTSATMAAFTALTMPRNDPAMRCNVREYLHRVIRNRDSQVTGAFPGAFFAAQLGLASRFRFNAVVALLLISMM